MSLWMSSAVVLNDVFQGSLGAPGGGAPRVFWEPFIFSMDLVMS